MYLHMNVSWQCHCVRCLKKVSAHSKTIYQTNALNSLGLKRHLFRIPWQRSNEDISVYVWVFLLLTRKLLRVVFVCHFKTTLQIFKVPCGFRFASCVSSYRWCCDIAHQHAHKHIYTQDMQVHTHPHRVTLFLYKCTKSLHLPSQNYVCLQTFLYM